MHSYLIVIYNQGAYESVTFKTLTDMLKFHPHKAHIVIWDNSLQPQHKSEINVEIPDLSVDYYHTGINERLSTIYNWCGEQCFNNGSTFFTIFDHDSQLSKNFKLAVEDSDDSLLIVPQVRSDLSGDVISPRYQKYNYLRNFCEIEYFSNTVTSGMKESKNFFAVASGLTISKNLWDTGLRFEEKLSFYGIDTEFCSDYSLQENFFFYMDSTIVHSASNENKEGKELSNWRLRKYYEHWEFQLNKYFRFPKLVASFYVSFFYLGYRLKNIFKR